MSCKSDTKPAPRPRPLRSLRFLFFCVDAAVTLHNNLLHHLLRLPKTFFDTNPAGAWEQGWAAAGGADTGS